MLIDDEQGMHSTKNVYSDLDIDKLETLAPTQPHRNVDLTLVEADGQGGICSSLNVHCNVQGPHNIQQGMLTRTSFSPVLSTALRRDRWLTWIFKMHIRSKFQRSSKLALIAAKGV